MSQLTLYNASRPCRGAVTVSLGGRPQNPGRVKLPLSPSSGLPVPRGRRESAPERSHLLRSPGLLIRFCREATPNGLALNAQRRRAGVPACRFERLPAARWCSIASSFQKLGAGCPRNRQAGSPPYLPGHTSLSAANLIPMVSPQMPSAVGQASPPAGYRGFQPQFRSAARAAR